MGMSQKLTILLVQLAIRISGICVKVDFLDFSLDILVV
jgi:hypothetical protein